MGKILTECPYCRLISKKIEVGNVCDACNIGIMKNIPGLPKKIGMHNETPRLTVGKYTISRQDPGGEDKSVWIEFEDGSGGEFHDALFEAAIKEFYDKNL